MAGVQTCALPISQLISAIRERFPTTPVADVYDHPRIGALAAALDESGPVAAASRDVTPVPPATGLAMTVLGLPVQVLAERDLLLERLRAAPRPGQPPPAWLLVDARQRRGGEATLLRTLAERGTEDTLQVLWLQDEPAPTQARQQQLPGGFSDATLHALLATPTASARPAALLAPADQGQETAILPPQTGRA